MKGNIKSKNIYDKIKHDNNTEFGQIDLKLLPSGITFTQLDEISSQTDITKNYVGYSQANLKHFDENYNDSKSILMCCTHSSLPESSKKSLMVPIIFVFVLPHLFYI